MGLLCLAHLLFITFLFIVLRFYLGKPLFPAETELLQWDAEHYHAISQKGYFGINVAFFPLLPGIWRFLGLNAYGITLFNILIFYAGFLWLAKLLALKKKEILLALSVPGFMFLYVPYTEALCFFYIVLLLYSIQRKNIICLYSSLLILSLTRPIISVLLPALLLTFFIKYKRNNNFYTLNVAIGSFGFIVLGILILASIQKWYTGVAWGFFTIIIEHWHHYLQVPNLPLASWENSTRLVLLLDGIAFFISIVCAFKVIQQFWFRFKHPDRVLDGVTVLSILYLAGSGAVVLLFQGGTLMNMNRYVFATAFFVVVFKHFADTYKFKLVHLIYLFLGLEVFWLLFKSYDRFRTFVRLNLASVYFSGILTVFHRNAWVKNFAFAFFYLVNCLAQIYCLDVFMSGQWIS